MGRRAKRVCAVRHRPKTAHAKGRGGADRSRTRAVRSPTGNPVRLARRERGSAEAHGVEDRSKKISGPRRAKGEGPGPSKGGRGQGEETWGRRRRNFRLRGTTGESLTVVDGVLLVHSAAKRDLAGRRWGRRKGRHQDFSWGRARRREGAGPRPWRAGSGPSEPKA